MIHSTVRQLGTGKLVPILSIALLSIASLSLAKPADAAQFTLSGNWECLFDCTDTVSSGLIQGNFSLDDITGEATDWLITTPTNTYQSGQLGSTSSNPGFALIFSQSTTNQSTWLTLFANNFLDPAFQSAMVSGNENTEMVSSTGEYTYGSYWEGEAKVTRQPSSAAVPEPTFIAGTLLTLVGGGWFKKRRKSETVSA